MKYIMVTWPEIQNYMNLEGYPELVYFDPMANYWFIPESWETKKELEDEKKR